jgi:hypothetical protein
MLTANQLLVKLVSYFEVLYGNNIMVCNAHCLVHLTNDVKNLGSLDDFGSIIFENKLGQLKRSVRKPHQVLQQTVRRLNEEASLDVGENVVGLEPALMTGHHDGPIMHGFHGAYQFKCVQTKQFTISINTGDNCILLEGCIQQW